MIISMCGSLDFIPKIKKASDRLVELGHKALLPKSAEMVINGELTMEEIRQENMTGRAAERKIRIDAIKFYYNKISQSDAILVLNYTKKGVENYIGGNTFLEMGFAHVLDKKIFLLNGIPDMLYRDEIEAMRPVILNDDLSLIK